jgi:hypothetical protein
MIYVGSKLGRIFAQAIVVALAPALVGACLAQAQSSQAAVLAPKGELRAAFIASNPLLVTTNGMSRSRLATCRGLSGLALASL